MQARGRRGPEGRLWNTGTEGQGTVWQGGREAGAEQLVGMAGKELGEIGMGALHRY